MNMYKIKQAAERLGISVRTLQYYDDIGLASPSERSENGYRYYTEENLVQLQLITTLKYCGYSLSQIKTFLSDHSIELVNALEIQSQVLDSKIQQLTQARQLTQQIQQELALHQHIDWSITASLARILQQKNADLANKLKLLLNDSELQQFKKIQQRSDEQATQQYQQRWLQLYAKVATHLQSNPDPASATSQALLNEWMQLVDEIYGPDIKLQYKIWQGMKAGALDSQQNNPQEQAIFAFIDQAIAARHKPST